MIYSAWWQLIEFLVAIECLVLVGCLVTVMTLECLVVAVVAIECAWWQ